MTEPETTSETYAEKAVREGGEGWPGSFGPETPSDPRKLAELAKERAYPVRETQKMVDALADAVLRLVEALEGVWVEGQPNGTITFSPELWGRIENALESREGDNP